VKTKLGTNREHISREELIKKKKKKLRRGNTCGLDCERVADAHAGFVRAFCSVTAER